MVLEFEKPVDALETRLRDLENRHGQGEENLAREVKSLQTRVESMKQKIYSNLSPWQRVQIARHPKRPYITDYIPRLFDDFMELHGDRAFGDDAAVLGGMAFFGKTPAMVIGHRKGRSLQESMERNFGMPHPEGYRKALRLMKLAEQFRMPIFTFIDTPGAYPGIGAEERGQAEAIARNLREMAAIEVPILVTVLGEGGSGGALAVGVGDAILMLENAWYSVISPEGCAAILFHDAAKAELAAESLKLTAQDLVKFNVIDEIVSEPLGGAHKDPDEAAANLKKALQKRLKYLSTLSTDKLIRNRFEKFRSIGVWQERTLASSANRPKKKQQTKTRKK